MKSERERSAYLLLEVSDSVVVGIGEEVHAFRRLLDVILEVIHQVRAIAL